MTETVTYPSGAKVRYTISREGTYFHQGTSPELARILDEIRKEGARVKVTYSQGDTERGYIGRSTGPVKVPLLVALSSSTGGGALYAADIVKIEHANKKNGGVIWQQ